MAANVFFFLNKLFEVLCSMEDRRQVTLSLEAKRDINWFLKFLSTCNSITFFVDASIELDVNVQGLGWFGEIKYMPFNIPLATLTSKSSS